MTRFDGLPDGVQAPGRAGWESPERLPSPPPPPTTMRPGSQPARKRDRCEFCGDAPMAGSGCPIHDPFTVLVLVFVGVLIAVPVMAVVAVALGWAEW